MTTELEIRPFAGGPFGATADPATMIDTIARLCDEASEDDGSAERDRAASFLLACVQGSGIWRDEAVPVPVPQCAFRHRGWDDGLPNMTVWDRRIEPGSERQIGSVSDDRLPDDHAIHACAAAFAAVLELVPRSDHWEFRLDDPTSLRNVRPMDPIETLRILDGHAPRKAA